MELNNGPEFPLTVTSHANGDAWTFVDAGELVGSLPQFDSGDPAQASSVIDGRGRLVRLVIDNGRITALELVQDWPDLHS